MAKLMDCPKGHILRQCNALEGSCDGCGRYIAAGETVMDCRSCNYYLCDTCHPQQEHPGTSVWGMVSSLFTDLRVTCDAPRGRRAADDEVLVEAVEPAGIPIRDPRHNRRADGNIVAAAPKTRPQQEEQDAKAVARKQDRSSTAQATAQAYQMPDLLDLYNDVVVEAPFNPNASGAGAKQPACGAGSVQYGGA
mmetsp:Transcript_8528/g.16122  ORF Transcript_8528/g.16122 Transcript_8528/m.16122 type:complete len:193 (+) Transcript_8528:63-641(+)|eukprot:CAMPEP_0172868626 /NCGR_PEP_ID=MMETSP1075-20121228/86795_1 /TAXON_ID=2916 /ORGANISM="Ceratium fusus, Strain PA161109" /LENGTH=192 /DNA_ID=CAMNT_0013718303 /DNA_START=56 /DNA_END=634 /DNA_ORIENTATION=-